MPDLHQLCEDGQQHLLRTQYLDAERLLAEAERLAWAARDWDTLSRVYMPLQEARRQRRQRCGEGTVKLDLIATSPTDAFDPEQVVARYPHGQLLVAGWGTIEPARRVRQIATERDLYLDCYLAAAYPVNAAVAVAIVPTLDVALPPPDGRPLDRLIATLPPHAAVIPTAELPPGERRGTDATYAETMALWERLHAPFLALADATTDPVQRMAAYRRTIDVDYACELAHQNLSRVAKRLLQAAR